MAPTTGLRRRVVVCVDGTWYNEDGLEGMPDVQLESQRPERRASNLVRTNHDFPCVFKYSNGLEVLMQDLRRIHNHGNIQEIPRTKLQKRNSHGTLRRPDHLFCLPQGCWAAGHGLLAPCLTVRSSRATATRVVMVVVFFPLYKSSLLT